MTSPLNTASVVVDVESILSMPPSASRTTSLVGVAGSATTGPTGAALGPTPSAAAEFREAILGQPVVSVGGGAGDTLSADGVLERLDLHDVAPFHLDPEFDVSTRHLVKVFNQLDVDKTGLLTYEQAAEGLRGLWRSTQTISDSLLWRLVREIDSDGSRNVTQEEFVRFMQEYVARNAESATGTLAECFCYDYSRTSSSVTFISPDGADDTTPLSEFLAGSRYPADRDTVRWVHVAGRDASTVLRIATRYNLSQLEVEDALNDYEAPKISTFPSRVQLVMNELYLIQRTKDGPDADPALDAATIAQLEVHNSNLNVFLIENRVVLSIARCKTDVTRILQQRILYPGSKMRLHDARFLFYSIVDTVIDQGFPILKALQDEMAVYQTEIYSEEATSLHVIRRLAFTQREVDKLESYYPPITSLIAKMPDVLCNADTSDVCEAGGGGVDRGLFFFFFFFFATILTPRFFFFFTNILAISFFPTMQYNDYLRKHVVDIGEHGLTLAGMVTRLAKWGRSLNQMYNNESQAKMNEVMMSLTLLTATFMPVQLLSGIFGMNFTHNWGILDWKYSYVVFWIVVLAIGTSMFILFTRLGWIRRGASLT
jgi:magnesium transporter